MPANSSSEIILSFIFWTSSIAKFQSFGVSRGLSCNNRLARGVKCVGRFYRFQDFAFPPAHSVALKKITGRTLKCCKISPFDYIFTLFRGLQVFFVLIQIFRYFMINCVKISSENRWKWFINLLGNLHLKKKYDNGSIARASKIRKIDLILSSLVFLIVLRDISQYKKQPIHWNIHHFNFSSKRRTHAPKLQ